MADRGRGGRGRGGPATDRGRGGYGAPRGGRGGARGGFTPGPTGPVIFKQDGILRPSPAVLKTENETELNIKTSQLNLSTATAVSSAMPLRPGYGTIGSSVVLFANHLDLQSAKDVRYYRYAIEMMAETLPKGKKLQRVVDQLLSQHLPQHKDHIATDHKALLISNIDLGIATVSQEYRVKYCSEHEEEPLPNADTYTIRLHRKDSPTFGDLIAFLCSTDPRASFDLKQEVLQALNVIIGHHPKSQNHISSIGANKHYDVRSAQHSLGAGLHAIRGYFVSVRPATGRLLVNVQVKPAAFYNQGSLEALIDDYDRSNGISGRGIYDLGKFLNKISVEVTHIVKKNKQGKAMKRVKTIAGLATPSDGKELDHPPRVERYGAGPDSVEFWLDGDISPPNTKGPLPQPAKTAPGRYISVTRFFKENYNINITRKNLPVINVGSRNKPVYLPAQVCTVIAGQPCKSKLSANQTASMINFAVRNPSANAASIASDGIKLLGLDPANSTLKSFGLSAPAKLITVDGRRLEPPGVRYMNDVTRPKFGSWNMQDKKFAVGCKNFVWVSMKISYTTDRSEHFPWQHEGDFTGTIDAFEDIMKKCGLQPRYVGGINVSVDSRRPEELLKTIQKAIQRFTRPADKTRSPPAFLLGILPQDDKLIYNALKRTCDISEGILNVNVLARSFMTKGAQYYANVALKVNIKLGGRNQELSGPDLGIIAGDKTMLVGIDVTHPAPGSDARAPSISAIVASVDKNLAQFPAELCIQPARQEEVSEIEELFKSRLRYWAIHHRGEFPENIIIYRDGVSEGQFTMVLERELPNYKQACRAVYPNGQMPKMSVIIVGKRHNTRFYATSESSGDRNGNPQSGTFVDRGVTEARNWDFYLQAHTAIKGTARPAHYYVVHDEIFSSLKVKPPHKTPSDALIAFTHNLCYTFSRATKAISICPPAYYADLACDRARLYMSQMFEPINSGASTSSSSSLGYSANDIKIHSNVKNRMFYI